MTGFADLLQQMKVKRHEADYGHDRSWRKSAVLADIAQARVMIELFQTAPSKDRRSYLSAVVFRDRE